MTTTHRIFRNCALALPLVVLGAGGLGGSQMAAQVAVAGAVGVLHLGLKAWLGTRMVELSASGDGGGLYGMLFALENLLIFPVFFGLMVLVGPLAAVVGFSIVFLATALTGLELALASEPPSPSESR